MSVFHSGGEVVEGVGGSPERSGARIFPLNDECAAEVRQKREVGSSGECNTLICS